MPFQGYLLSFHEWHLPVYAAAAAAAVAAAAAAAAATATATATATASVPPTAAAVLLRWVQTGAVTGHPKLRGLRHIRIDNPPTVSRFWRWHAEGEGHICTAEGEE